VLAGVRTRLNSNNYSLQFKAGYLKIREPFSFFIFHSSL
jgi:hypothetical protein